MGVLHSPSVRKLATTQNRSIRSAPVLDLQTPADKAGERIGSHREVYRAYSMFMNRELKQASIRADMRTRCQRRTNTRARARARTNDRWRQRAPMVRG